MFQELHLSLVPGYQTEGEFSHCPHFLSSVPPQSHPDGHGTETWSVHTAAIGFSIDYIICIKNYYYAM